MKEMLNNLADGEIEFYQSVRHLIPFLCLTDHICRRWKSGSELYLLFNAYEWTFSTDLSCFFYCCTRRTYTFTWTPLVIRIK